MGSTCVEEECSVAGEDVDPFGIVRVVVRRLDP